MELWDCGDWVPEALQPLQYNSRCWVHAGCGAERQAASLQVRNLQRAEPIEPLTLPLPS